MHFFNSLFGLLAVAAPAVFAVTANPEALDALDLSFCGSKGKDCQSNGMKLINQKLDQCLPFAYSNNRGKKGSQFVMSYTVGNYVCTLYEDPNCNRAKHVSWPIPYPGFDSWDQDWNYQAFACSKIAGTKE